jgi:nitrogen-specific signal transduction histidine kinase
LHLPAGWHLDLCESRLRQSQFQQARKLEAIGTLAGGIAHDFNNILSAILGYSELALATSGQTPDLTLYLEKTRQAAGRAAELVRQILTFSRQTEQELQLLQPRNVVLDVLKLIRALLPSSIRITSQIDSHAFIMADPTQMHQIVMNLCTNAAQALEEEPGTIHISLEDLIIGPSGSDHFTELQAGDYVRLSVSDDGLGMATHVRERIFDPFFTTKPKGKGTGMGLSLVHGIVESYNGVIWVESAPGQGSTFTILIPATAAPAEMPRMPRPVVIPRGSEHILLVDDEESLVEIGRRMLQRLGYRVTAVTASLEALRLFTAHPDRFDLVITDQTMPQMTGDRLALKLLEMRPDLPVFICTGCVFSPRTFKNRGSGVCC